MSEIRSGSVSDAEFSSIAGLPVRIGARLLALRHLDDAAAARERILAGQDMEALHDFRVALRRLRSDARAWASWLGDTLTPGDRRRLRDLARGTSAARDLEVQLARLRRAALPPAVLPGALRLAAALQNQRRAADHAALRAVHRFPEAEHRLRAHLLHYTADIDVRSPLAFVACAAVAAAHALALLSELRASLDAVLASADRERIHAARIAGKRLRYLLEPFRDDLTDGRSAIQRLKALQDAFGDLHDTDVLLGRLMELAPSFATDAPAMLELEALDAQLRLEREEQFAAARGQWLDGTGGGVFGDVESFADRLAAVAPPRQYEIERKFLLRGLPRRRKGRSAVRIDQGWLPGERLVERVRRIRGPAGSRWFRTLKAGHGLARLEIEEEIDEALFRSLWRLTRGRRVAKRRYSFRDGEHVWEVDRFLDRDLVLAEVELRAVDEFVALPAWLAGFVVREVTGQRRYENAHLAC